MPNNERAEISKDSGFSRTVRKWLTIYGEAYRQEATEAQAKIYELGLKDLPAEEVHAAMKRALKGCKFFPSIAEIRACVEKPEADAETLEAERSWRGLERRRAEWGMDLTPVFQGGKFHYAPELDAATSYALAALGGWERFCNYETDLYALMRRDFIAAYKRHRETEGLLAPSRDEARRLLAHVDSWDRKKLPEARQEKAGAVVAR